MSFVTIAHPRPLCVGDRIRKAKKYLPDKCNVSVKNASIRIETANIIKPFKEAGSSTDTLRTTAS